MEMSPAAGKILGMLMAYAVSSLGLLLAYVNYRKRILKAEQIFTPVAKTVIFSVITLVVLGAVLVGAVASSDAKTVLGALGSNALGLLLPAMIVCVSVLLTYLLYRHFARQMADPGANGDS